MGRRWRGGYLGKLKGVILPGNNDGGRGRGHQAACIVQAKYQVVYSTIIQLAIFTTIQTTSLTAVVS